MAQPQPILPNFPVGQGLRGSPANSKPRTLSEGTIWELVVTRWRPFGMDQVAIAAAVLLAESGGRTDAINVNTDGSRDRGPWQINDRAHPDVPDSCAFDSVCSTDAALRIYKAAGNSFKPWVAFTSGSYKDKMGQVKIGDANVEEQGFAKIDPLARAMDFLEGFEILFDAGFWRRAGLILLGILAAVLGVYMIGREYLPSVPLPIKGA